MGERGSGGREKALEYGNGGDWLWLAGVVIKVENPFTQLYILRKVVAQGLLGWAAFPSFQKRFYLKPFFWKSKLLCCKTIHGLFFFKCSKVLPFRRGSSQKAFKVGFYMEHLKILYLYKDLFPNRFYLVIRQCKLSAVGSFSFYLSKEILLCFMMF